MRLISVNVGLPREVAWARRTVLTSIWKDPVQGPVRAAGHNLDGDRQSDLSVHGGPEKAVYAYPSEHYAQWRAELELSELPWGAFGENLTIEGLLEDEARIGDRLRIGSVELQVTQPRLPCFKLGIRFGRGDMVTRFLESGRPGFYLAIVRAGSIQAGDTIELMPHADHDVTVADVADAYATGDATLVHRVLGAPTLPQPMRERLQKRRAASITSRHRGMP